MVDETRGGLAAHDRHLNRLDHELCALGSAIAQPTTQRLKQSSTTARRPCLPGRDLGGVGHHSGSGAASLE
jgi:hypothetical protein